mgnify:CR=1 FL=1
MSFILRLFASGYHAYCIVNVLDDFCFKIWSFLGSEFPSPRKVRRSLNDGYRQLPGGWYGSYHV